MTDNGLHQMIIDDMFYNQTHCYSGEHIAQFIKFIKNIFDFIMWLVQ